MVITGHVADYPLSELLVFLGNKRHSGWLTLRNRGVDVVLTLRDGRLVAAESSNIDHRLGRRLVDQSLLSEAQLDQALDVQRRILGQAPLGSILIVLGMTDLVTVQDAMREQIGTNLVRLLVTPGGRFKFKRGMPESRGVDIDLPVEPAVFRAIHRADEWAAVISRSAGLALNPDVTEAMLKPVVVSGWPVIDAMLDGARSLDDVALVTGWTADKVIETIFRLADHQVVSITLPGQRESGLVLLPSRAGHDLAAVAG